jgi:hypothetical protein
MDINFKMCRNKTDEKQLNTEKEINKKRRQESERKEGTKGRKNDGRTDG